MSDPMKRLFRSTASPVLALPRSIKRLIALSVDICLCVLATWLAFYLRLGEFVTISNELGRPTLISIIIVLPIFAATGLYRAIFRYSGWPAIQAVARAMSLYGLIYMTTVMVVGIEGTPRTIGLIQPLLLFFAVAGSRLLARFWLGGVYRTQEQKQGSPRVIIYGAGSAGRQLASALASGDEMQIIGFFDDDDRLHGHVLNGLPIFIPDDLPNLIASRGVSYVLLAMPSVSRTRRNEILRYVSEHRVVVRTLPSVADLAEGRVTVNDIKELDIDDLLGRDSVAPNHIFLAKKVTGKTVLVTGAGGSIGSELCRQIIALNPSILLLIEVSEFGLYTIHGELESQKIHFGSGPQVRIIPLLCSIQDYDRVSEIISAWRPNTIYHAAAYKHVPLVEHNLAEGIKNNVFGTLNVVEAAIDGGVSDFVLVSTDKAVRPTNVMGATKRLAEMTLQALDAKRDSKTCLSIVRFGNVLESSGSVIPKFRFQIGEGGPVTVTHPEVTRFFMTIPEAAQLVIQASALAEGGDVFVLDMGDPIKILDLAEHMIQLSGLTVKTPVNPEGDIAIEITGLRPGEKLFEELLIGNNPVTTSHPKIMRASETYIPWPELYPELEKIKRVMDNNDIATGFSMLKKLVDGFEPEGDVVDWIHIKQGKQVG